MRKQLAFITALMALTLGVGIFAGAVVTKPVPSDVDVAGVPARIIRRRNAPAAASVVRPEATLHTPDSAEPATR